MVNQNERLADYEYKSVVLADESKLKKSSTGDYTKKSMDEAILKQLRQHCRELQKFANGQKRYFIHTVLRRVRI